MRVNMNKKRVSIIIPVYNGEKFLRNTLNQILSSEHANIEVLIIDDGSTDKSSEICLEIVKIDKRLIYFYKQNGGIVSARNMGLEKASGEYICFCDQDDIIFPNTYSDMLKRIENDESEICICSTGRWINNKINTYELLEDTVFSEEDIDKYLLMPMLLNSYKIPGNNSQVYFYSHIWKCMVRSRLFHEHILTFKKFINYEDDLIMLVDLLCCSKKVSTMSQVLYCWRLNFSSESYRSNYIVNLEEKQEHLLNYLYIRLQERKIDMMYLNMYFQAQMCRFYIDRIENEFSYKNDKTIREKIVYLRKSIFNDDSLQNLTVRRKLKPGQYKNKIALFFLSKKMICSACWFLMLYSSFTHFAIRFNWIVRLERRLKQIRPK